MAVQTACPPAKEFEQLLKRGASAEQNHRLLEHLESCPNCWQTVGPLLESDTLLKGVAVGRPNVTPELLSQLLALKTADSTGEFGAMSVTPVDYGDAPVDAPPPPVIGHYQLIRLLGRGGMGAVYLATDTRLNRKVALKVMLPRFAAKESAKERFLREARAAAQIANDNVVTIFEADERDGVPFIAMQYLNGATVEEHLKKNESFTVAQILRIGLETATGLAAAHALGLVHRDIKPGNLWLEAPSGRVKVLDFGLAKPLETAIELTGSGILVGTPAFMSPEQGRGKKVDGRTDLFSLGAVLYRLCTGRLPFDGPNTLAVLTSLGIDEPPPVRSVNPEVPEALAELIGDLLAKNPDHRPGSAAIVAERIREISADPTQAVRRKPPKTRWGIAAGYAALVAAMAFGIVIIIKNKDGTETKIDLPDGASVTVKDQDGKTLAAVANIKDSDWEKQVAGMIAEDQVAAIAARLKLLNPRFLENSMTHRIDNGVIVALELTDSSELSNLAPLRALTGLKDIHVHGRFRNPSDISPLRGLKLTSFQANGCPLKDLSPLAGMPLTRANFWGNTTADLWPLRGMKLVETNVGHGPTKDISVFKGMPLEIVCLNHSQVEDLSPLRGAPLKRLEADFIKATDLTPLANMPIELLHLKGTPIKDFTVVRTMALKYLELDYDPKLHAELLRSIPTLKMINFRPAADVLDGVADAPNRAAAEWVVSIGGFVKVSGRDQLIKSAAELPKDGFTLTAVIFFRNREVTDGGLARLAKLTNLQELVLYHTPITDAGVIHVKELTNLTRLDLGETRVTDAGLDVIKGLTKLTNLSIHYTAVTGPWLDNLKNFEHLASLNLNGAVNDAGLPRLVSCKSIKELMLVNTPITDAGLAVLKNMPGLTRIDVQNTKVTAAGLADFHAAVPRCKIEHNGGVFEAKK